MRNTKLKKKYSWTEGTTRPPCRTLAWNHTRVEGLWRSVCTQKRKKISFVPPTLSGNGAARDDEGPTLLIPEMCVPQRMEDEHLTVDSTSIYKVIIARKETYRVCGWREACLFHVWKSSIHSWSRLIWFPWKALNTKSRYKLLLIWIQCLSNLWLTTVRGYVDWAE